MKTYHRARCPLATCKWKSTSWSTVVRAISDLLDHMADKHRALVEVTGIEDGI